VLDLDGVRVCGVPDHIGAGRICQWPDPALPWTITDLVPGISEAEMVKAMEWAAAQWATVCGLEPVYVDRARDARLIITAQRLDGPSGTLADCMLPCGGISQAVMRLDLSEAWTASMSEGQRRVVLPMVLWHEMGHGIGLSHAPQGSMNVMAPVYNPRVSGAGSYDVEEAIRRYGRRRQKPTPSNPTTPTQPGDKMEDRLKEVLKLAAWIATMTPTPADDKIVAFLSNPLVMRFLSGLLERFGDNPTEAQVAEAMKLVAEQVA